MSKRGILQTSLLFIYFSGLSISQTCTTAHFPKTLGGSKGDTYIRSIAFHELTDSLAAVGKVEDIDIRSPNPYPNIQTGLIALFKGPLLTLAWGKTENDYR